MACFISYNSTGCDTILIGFIMTALLVTHFTFSAISLSVHIETAASILQSTLRG